MAFTGTPGLITVALCARNAESTIGEAVASILTQGYEQFELIVLDDFSDDQTFEAACDVSNDRRLKVLRLSRQIGTDAGKNYVLKNFAKGEYFAHQDADDISWSTRFSQQVAFFKAYPDVVACGTGIDEFFSEEDQYLTQHGDIPSDFPVEQGEDGYLHRKNIYPPFIGPDPTFDSYVIAMNGSLIFKTATLWAFGGVDGHSLVAAADTDTLLRLIKFYRVGNLPEVLYSRRFHRASATASAEIGRKSVTREAYRHLLDARHLYVRELIQAGRMDMARAICTEDMYYPEVEMEKRNWA